MLRGFLGVTPVLLFNFKGAAVTCKLQDLLTKFYKDEQTLFQHLQIITILISTCAYEKVVETLWSAVTNESIAAVIR